MSSKVKLAILAFMLMIVPNFSIAQVYDSSGFLIRKETPSKLPVPRFVSLRYDKVYGRGGPDDDYPIKYIYKRQGLPVKVTAETEIWRRVLDPDGVTVWVHKRNLDAKRTLIARASNQEAVNVPLYNKPKDGAKIIAKIGNGAICEIIKAEGGWRKVKIGKYHGWILASEAWGS